MMRSCYSDCSRINTRPGDAAVELNRYAVGQEVDRSHF
jgi:hypothetical protein